MRRERPRAATATRGVPQGEHAEQQRACSKRVRFRRVWAGGEVKAGSSIIRSIMLPLHVHGISHLAHPPRRFVPPAQKNHQSLRTRLTATGKHGALHVRGRPRCRRRKYGDEAQLLLWLARSGRTASRSQAAPWAPPVPPPRQRESAPPAAGEAGTRERNAATCGHRACGEGAAVSPAASVHLSPSHRSMREHRLRRTASLTYVIMCALSQTPPPRPAVLWLRAATGGAVPAHGSARTARRALRL